MNHSDYMLIALNQAKNGIGRVEPNPYVGAVIAKNNKILATGSHKFFGGPHAEIDALAKTSTAKGASLYVTLEPCCHYGKTPPCTRAIIKSGITRVFAAAKDSNKLVNGRGLKELKSAGIKVDIGLLQDQAEKLNRHFFYFNKTSLPYISAKWAMTLDGKIASKTGDSKWISSITARSVVKKLRKEYQAVMIGVGTVSKDNPRLHAITRIILDSDAKTPLNCNIVKSAKKYRTIIATLKGKGTKLKNKGCEIIQFKKMNIKNIAGKLAQMGIIKILAEGGSAIYGSLFDSKLVQEVYVFIAPKVLGGAKGLTAVSGLGQADIDKAFTLHDITIQNIGQDFLMHGYVKY